MARTGLHFFILHYRLSLIVKMRDLNWVPHAITQSWKFFKRAEWKLKILFASISILYTLFIFFLRHSVSATCTQTQYKIRCDFKPIENLNRINWNVDNSSTLPIVTVLNETDSSGYVELSLVGNVLQHNKHIHASVPPPSPSWHVVSFIGSLSITSTQKYLLVYEV